jgi:F0F1-type ATP synthase membrane subunit c/vacuolar-type H+-ATPase subunit K
MPYIFAAAALLAVIPILILYKKNLEKLKEDPGSSGKVQQNFMIGVAVSEIIPILLIIFGFVNMERVSSITELYIPGLIVLLALSYSISFILWQKSMDVQAENKAVIHSFSMVSIPITTAIPFISLVGLILMLPQ